MNNLNEAFEIAFQKILSELDNSLDKKILSEARPHIKKIDSINDFCNSLSNLYYNTHQLHSDFRKLNKRLLPVVLLGKSSLFVCGKDERIYDCTLNKYITKNELPKKYQILFFTPFTTIEQQPNNIIKVILKKFSKYYWQCWILSFFINLLALATPIFIIAIYNQVIATFSPILLIPYSIGIFLALICFAFFYMLRSQILIQTSSYIDKYLTQYSLKHILNLPNYLIESSSKSSQISRLRDFNMIHEFLTSQLLIYCFDLPFTLVSLILIAVLGGWLVIFPILAIAFFSCLFLYCWFSPELSLTKNDLGNEQHQKTIELLSNLTNIKNTNLKKHFFDSYKEITAKKSILNSKSSLATNRRVILSDAAILTTGLLLVCFAAIRAINGDMSAGVIIAIVILNWRVLGPYKGFYCYTKLFQYIFKSFKEINKLFNIQEETVKNSTPPANSIQGNIVFNHVSFRFPGSESASLNDISFQVNSNEIIAITGDSGSGKSTLLKLLLSLYQPSFGEIYLDHNRLEQYPKAWLKHRIAYCSQEFSFIYGTLAQNLRLTSINASTQALWHVCEIAGIAEEIRLLPQGLDTRIHDQELEQYGSAFLQGLSLARAYLKHSKLILLDDPVCHLDNRKTEKFYQYLLSMHGNATVILTTHRPSIMKLADQLIILDQGKIVKQGHPKNILAKSSKSYI